MHLHGFYFHVEGVGDGERERYYAPAEVRMVKPRPPTSREIGAR
jgi:hypothetical protein